MHLIPFRGGVLEQRVGLWVDAGLTAKAVGHVDGIVLLVAGRRARAVAALGGGRLKLAGRGRKRE